MNTRLSFVDKLRASAGWQRWHAMAAAVILAATVFDQWVGHQTNICFAASIEVDREWSERFDPLGQLRQTARAAHVPGNDVFASRDAAADRRRFDTAQV